MTLAHWLDELRAALREREAQGLLRRLRTLEHDGRFVLRDGRRLLNLASNDYLGLSSHPALREAAIQAVERWGCGAGASRLVSGHLEVHERAEDRFARFKHAEAALLLPTGYMANHALITALAGRGDLVCLDKLNHASLIDAARASGATVRTFAHLDYPRLERLLKERRRSYRRAYVVTDSVFSMDGDVADLPALCDIGDRYETIVLVDEAHATGIFGEHGAGLCELQQVTQRVGAVVSTASKGLGGLGGIVTGPGAVIDTLVNHARSFIYTTAVPPAQAAVLIAALDVVEREPQRRRRVTELARRFAGAVATIGNALQPADARQGVATPIVPLVTGSVESAAALARHLEDHGIHAPAIRPPTVPRGSSRVRISLRADLTDADFEQLLTALQRWGARTAESA